ncbi:hypothetical protein T484DRAFT_1757075 [Baffinella frigidus]|nr:hypothetical protein T484DRAFT_1757075 [Cryptophyta sp. CCMP2293]
MPNVDTPVVGGLVDKRFTIYPLTMNETETATVLVNGVDYDGSLSDSSSRLIRMLPNHHIDRKGVTDEGRKAWVCDEPVSIGVYHAYARRFKDVREHCLFVVCSGGCRTACDQFMNIAVDLASVNAATTQELCDSQEVWLLRTLCSRMRGRLINRVAQAFALPVLTVRNPYSFDTDQVMFLSHIETLSHDIQPMRRGTGVSVYNECVNTSTTRNGILCNMNMSEGYWLFKGPPSNCDSTLDYGSVFGNERDCGIFPTSASRLTKEQMTHNMNHGCHVVVDTCSSEGFVFPDEKCKQERSNCIKFDESFMRNLETMGWQRDNGIMEMMPIVLVIRNSIGLDLSKFNRGVQLGVVVMFAALGGSIAMSLFNFNHGMQTFILINFMPHQIVLLIASYIMYRNTHFEEIDPQYVDHYKKAIFSGVHNAATMPFMALLVCILNSWTTMPMLQFVYTTVILINVVDMAYNCTYIDSNKPNGQQSNSENGKKNAAKYRMRQAIYLLLVSLLLSLSIVIMVYFPQHTDTVHRVVGTVFIGLIWILHIFFDCTKASIDSYQHEKQFNQYDGFVAMIGYALLFFSFYAVWGP